MPAPVDHVSVHARLQPERTAVVDLLSDRRWSYCQFDRAIGATAAAFVRRNIIPGDRVAALARNRAELLLLHLACARMGAIYVPLNWRLSPPELAALVEDAEPSILIGDNQLAVSGLHGMQIDELSEEIDATDPMPTGPIDRSRPSLILYTSGTSGRPKGVLLSEANIDQTALNFGLHARVTNTSVFLNDPPMFHVIGLITAVRAPLMHGATVLVSDGFDAGRTIARIDDASLAVTHYFAVPQTAAMLRSHPDYEASKFKGLTGIFSGGAPHSAAAIRAWLDDGIAMADGFGMSEAGTVTCMPLDRHLIAERAGSTGIAMPGVRLRTVDASGIDCEPGRAGELLLKGANITSGYWRRSIETAAAFDADGWFRTGDIAAIEEDGFLTLIDRKKDMYISGGENVYPAEVEAVVGQHPAVAQCAVVGVPDPKWGEVGHLAVVLHSGKTVTDEDMAEFLRLRLARFKHPKHMSRLASLPSTSSGKVQRTLLREQLAAGKVQISSPAS